MGKHYLNKLFEPGSVAVFGASDRQDAVGNLVFRNMIEGGFSGDVFPINPKHSEVQGHKAYPDLNSIGKPVDLAVITTPAATVPGIIESCGEHGIRAAVVLSAGFRETGPQGLNYVIRSLDTRYQTGKTNIRSGCVCRAMAAFSR